MSARAVIVEDEPLARRTLRDFLGGADWVELVGEAEDGPSAVRLLGELRPDLVFLDVKMPGLSGLEVLERLDYEPAVVFATAYDAYALEAFEIGALDYLLKPFGRERFERTLERVRRRLGAASVVPERERAAALGSNAPITRLFVRRGEQVVPVPVDEVMRLEAEGDYVVVHAAGGRFFVSVRLGALERRLDPERFRRVHRSHLVNLDHVASFETLDRRLLIRMKDGSEVLASRAASQSLRDLIL